METVKIYNIIYQSLKVILCFLVIGVWAIGVFYPPYDKIMLSTISAGDFLAALGFYGWICMMVTGGIVKLKLKMNKLAE